MLPYKIFGRKHRKRIRSNKRNILFHLFTEEKIYF
jgi:hypothetical protein